MKAKATLGIEVVSHFYLELHEGFKMAYVALVKEFGTANGRLILSDFNRTAIYLAEANGYGWSCLPEWYAKFNRSSLRCGTDF